MRYTGHILPRSRLSCIQFLLRTDLNVTLFSMSSRMLPFNCHVVDFCLLLSARRTLVSTITPRLVLTREETKQKREKQRKKGQLTSSMVERSSVWEETWRRRLMRRRTWGTVVRDVDCPRSLIAQTSVQPPVLLSAQMTQ